EQERGAREGHVRTGLLGREQRGSVRQTDDAARNSPGSEASQPPVLRVRFAPMAAPPRKPVLIVDDDRDIREGLQELLESEGHSVFTATDGQDALERLAT